MKHGTFWKYIHGTKSEDMNYFMCVLNHSTQSRSIQLTIFIYSHRPNFTLLHILMPRGHFMLFICSSIREGNRQRFWGTKHNWVNVVNDSCPFQFLCQNFFINHWLMVRQWVSNSIHCILSRFTIYIRHQTYCCNWLTLKLIDTPYTSFVEKCHFWINRPAFFIQLKSWYK